MIHEGRGPATGLREPEHNSAGRRAEYVNPRIWRKPMKEVPVLIAGGGPVGMTLAKTLASFGIECMLVEKNPSTTRHPKMDITNSRSMELFRKLGVSKHLRDVAVPETNNFDVSWITSLSGRELHRFRYPSVEQARAIIRDR